MLKWAVTPRLNDEVLEHKGIHSNNNYELLTLEAIIAQHQLPCLVRLIHDDLKDSIDNYCLLLGETTEPYLIVSNETERFSIPLSFDGLFASVERGLTCYNILQSIRSLQVHLKSPSSPSSNFTHFTTLQSYTASSNSPLRRIPPGTLLEPCYHPTETDLPSSPSSLSSNRLRTLFVNLPRSFNKRLLPNYQQSRSMKKQILSNDYIEVKSNLHEQTFTLKVESTGLFIPIYSQLPFISSYYRPPYSSNEVQGLYTTNLLGKLSNQYPLITELIVSRTLEENVSETVGYPLRRITLHRLVENHPRILAFDMTNYTFIELDKKNSVDIYAIQQDKTLFQRYQAQLRWCHQHLPSFRSQIKTSLHLSNGTSMFIQATSFNGQSFQQYHQRRSSLSAMSSPLTKHMPYKIFTSYETVSSGRLLSSKFYSTSNHPKYEQKRHHGKIAGSAAITRKDVRTYFNDPTTHKHLHTKHAMFHRKDSNHRMNSTESENTDADEGNENSYQCTAL